METVAALSIVLLVTTTMVLCWMTMIALYRDLMTLHRKGMLTSACKRKAQNFKRLWRLLLDY